MIDECGQELTEALEMFSVSFLFTFTFGGYMRGLGDVLPLPHPTCPLRKITLTI